MKKIHTAVTLIIIFFMVAALYICGRYENVPDRIFTGKVSAPEGEWTIDASDGVTKARALSVSQIEESTRNGCCFSDPIGKIIMCVWAMRRSITGTEKEMDRCICLIFHQETV